MSPDDYDEKTRTVQERTEDAGLRLARLLMTDGVASIVVLEDGMIWSWRSVVGRLPPRGSILADRYFPGGDPGRGTFVQAQHRTFEDAERWRRQWPVHPDAPGFPPGAHEEESE